MKIYWKYFALFLSYLPKIIADDLSCITEDVPRIRIFQTLVQYQANKLSFNPHDSTYDGNYVSFSFYSISHLEKNAFNTFTSSNIISIDLSEKSIKKIDDGAFLTLSCLQQLDLSYNEIDNLSKDMFKELVNLRTLNISRNYLIYWHDHVFSSLKRIQIVDISYNNIRELDEKVFYDIPTLEKLIMSHNHMKRTGGVYFNQLINLKELYLDHNNIAILHAGCFSENVQKLDLSGNGIIMIFPFTVDHKMSSIQHLNLSDNYLTTLQVENISYYLSNPNLTIDFNNNQFDCKDWVQYLNEFKEKGINISPGRTFTQQYNINGIACHTVNFYHTDLYSDEDTDDVQAKLEDDKQYEVGLNNTLDNIVHEVNQSKSELSDKLGSTTFSGIKKPGTENSGNGVVTGVTIALAIIGVILLALVTVNHVLGIGFMMKMRKRVRHFMGLSSDDDNEDYLSLTTPT